MVLLLENINWGWDQQGTHAFALRHFPCHFSTLDTTAQRATIPRYNILFERLQLNLN